VLRPVERIELTLRGADLSLEQVAPRDRSDLEEGAHAALIVTRELERAGGDLRQTDRADHQVELAARTERHVLARALLTQTRGADTVARGLHARQTTQVEHRPRAADRGRRAVVEGQIVGAVGGRYDLRAE